MKELDFDLFLSQETGRTLYRGFITFGFVFLLKNHSTSVRTLRSFKFIEEELWKQSNCFVGMKPRMRLLYTCVVCSFIPFFLRKSYEHLFEEKVMDFKSNLVVGILSGGAMAGITLSF